MCRKPLQRSADALCINHSIASAIRQRAATARLLDAVNHGGFQPLAATWAANLAAAPPGPPSSLPATTTPVAGGGGLVLLPVLAKTLRSALSRKLLSSVSVEAVFQAGIAKSFSLGMPYDLAGAARLFAVAAAGGHAPAATHLAYLQVSPWVGFVHG
jgi:hypothetical protein